MGKNPAFQFYVKDWLSDPELQSTSSSTRGIWINALCFMWEARERGKIEGTTQSLSRILNCTEDEFGLFLKEVSFYNFSDLVTNTNGKVTLINRRMSREYNEVISHRKRQDRYRNKLKDKDGDGISDQEVTPPSPSPSPSPSSKENIYSIFSFWNEQQIIVHRETKTSLAECINARLEKYKVDEIKEAIKNYKTILFSNDYYWTHKWTLKQFLQRGLDLFSTSNNPFDNYRKKSKERSGVIDITKTTEEIK